MGWGLGRRPTDAVRIRVLNALTTKLQEGSLKVSTIEIKDLLSEMGVESFNRQNE